MEGSHVSGNDEHYAVMEEAELTGAARDEEDLGIEHERDLDDSVPEAGSYQHTDTYVEDRTDDASRRDPREHNKYMWAVLQLLEVLCRLYWRREGCRSVLERRQPERR